VTGRCDEGTGGARAAGSVSSNLPPGSLSNHSNELEQYHHYPNHFSTAEGKGREGKEPSIGREGSRVIRKARR
jgi:hypothetical protein